MATVGERLEANQAGRRAEKDRRKADAALLADPAESANVFWQEFNMSKAEATRTIEEAEAVAGQENGEGAKPGGQESSQAAALLRQASVIVAGMQEKVARATLFLPGYDQRLANDAVTGMHGAVGEAKRRVFPPSSFTFKARKSPPASLAFLIAEMRQEVGTTAGDRLQGDTKAEELDPELVFADREGETLVKRPGEIRGRDLVLSRLTNCTVFVCDPCGAVRADRLQNCKVFLGPVRSVLAEKLDACSISVAAQQLRVHSATGCDFYVRMRSGPIIEHSNGNRFAPYNFEYPGQESQLGELKLTTDSGMWAKVEDFNWLRAQQSPNWSILPEDLRAATVVAPSEACPPEASANAAHEDDEM